MKIFKGFDKARGIKNPVVTVGSYDGVHLGHREIFKRLGALAEVCGGESVVVTFEPHPRKLLGNYGDPVRLLNSMDEKILLMEQAGIDNLIVVDFDDKFSKLSYEEFIRDILVGKLNMKYLVLGYNHHFGRDKEGDYDNLKVLARDLDFEVSQMEAQTIDGGKISSTVIRNLIANGFMEKATTQLGTPYFMIGTVKDGFLVSDEPCKLIPSAGQYKVLAGDPTGGGKISAVVEIDSKGKVRLETGKPAIKKLLAENKKILIKFV